MKLSIGALSVALVVSVSPQAQATTPAEAVFGSYQSLERSFDSSVADMYCDSALIRNVRTYPGGQQRTLQLPAPKYKELIRAAMPLAKAKGDYSTYSQVVFAPEGYSVVKQYSSPISLLVGACNGKDWAILEELSQSQP